MASLPSDGVDERVNDRNEAVQQVESTSIQLKEVDVLITKCNEVEIVIGVYEKGGESATSTLGLSLATSLGVKYSSIQLYKTDCSKRYKTRSCSNMIQFVHRIGMNQEVRLVFENQWLRPNLHALLGKRLELLIQGEVEDVCCSITHADVVADVSNDALLFTHLPSLLLKEHSVCLVGIGTVNANVALETQHLLQQSFPKVFTGLDLGNIISAKNVELENGPAVQPGVRKSRGACCEIQYAANNPIEDRVVSKRCLEYGLACYLVIDGHGGSLAADFVQHTLLDAIIARWKTGISNEEIRESISAAFQAVDDAFSKVAREHVENNAQYKHAGACCVVGILYDAQLIVAHVGDCRAVLCRAIDHDHVQAIDLSCDHNCLNEAECDAVRGRSRDQNAIRLSPNDAKKGFGLQRVAGSLAVTRAFGDLYLKDESFSRSPLHDYMPYISVAPDISIHAIEDEDQFVVLASDGVFEFLTSQTTVETVHSTASDKNPCEHLLDAVLDKVSKKNKLPKWYFRKHVPNGPKRRAIHDDVSCMVITL